MLFLLEPLSSPCHSSNSLPLWPRVSMKLPNNKMQMQHWNLMKSKKCTWFFDSTGLVWVCLMLQKYQSSISTERNMTQESHFHHNSFEMFAFKDVSHRREKKWLVFRLDMYLEIFFPHLVVNNSYSDRWGEVFILRIDNYQCVWSQTNLIDYLIIFFVTYTNSSLIILTDYWLHHNWFFIDIH